MKDFRASETDFRSFFPFFTSDSVIQSVFLMICCRIKRVRSNFVGRIRKMIRGRFVVALVTESIISHPEYHYGWETADRVMRRVCMRVATG